MNGNVTRLGPSGWLNRTWRLVGTALSFALFGIGGLILGTLVFPLFFVFVRDKDRRQRFARTLIGVSFSAFVWFMKTVGVLTYEIHGDYRHKDLRNTLIIANHPSLIDVVFLVSFFPQTECVVKRAITRNPFTRGVVSAANYIPNTDPEILLSTCTARLKGGSSLVLFPEGTRREPDAPLKFKMGAAAIAVRANARILPIVIECVPPTLRKGEPWFHIPRQRPHWTFVIPPAVSVQRFIGQAKDEREAIRRLQPALLSHYQSQLSAHSGLRAGPAQRDSPSL